ncbi:MAG: 30S ribosome-binding factor RbfA [Gammaproteobacteria bacterium]|nr:30S ribosome-binding factor RbfA [Gammaproteobacteria bacterium]
MPKPIRSEIVATQIAKDIAEILVLELKDPRLLFVSIQDIKLAPDYSTAKVYFSLLKGDEATITKVLNAASNIIRKHLFKRLTLHTIPRLYFEFDATLEKSRAMQALIDKAIKLT